MIDHCNMAVFFIKGTAVRDAKYINLQLVKTFTKLFKTLLFLKNHNKQEPIVLFSTSRSTSILTLMPLKSHENQIQSVSFDAPRPTVQYGTFAFSILIDHLIQTYPLNYLVRTFGPP